MLFPLLMEIQNLRQDAQLGIGDCGTHFEQRSDFREDERRAGQSVERRLGFDAFAEIDRSSTEACCQVRRSLFSPKRQQPQP